MGHLFTSVTELDNIRFKPFPARPRKGLIVARASYGSSLWGYDPKEPWVVYTTARIADNVAALPSLEWPWIEDLLKALDKFKLVGKPILDAYRKHCAAVDTRSSARDALGYGARQLEKLGVPLTKSQIARLEKIAYGGKKKATRKRKSKAA